MYIKENVQLIVSRENSEASTKGDQCVITFGNITDKRGGAKGGSVCAYVGEVCMCFGEVKGGWGGGGGLICGQ